MTESPPRPKNFFTRRSINKLNKQVYNIYTTGNTSGEWKGVIVDQQGQTFLLNGVETNTNYTDIQFYIRTQLSSVLEALEWISDNLNEETETEVKFYHNNIYIINILREWIYKWSKENFESCPHNDIMRKINDILEKIKIVPVWVSTENQYEQLMNK